MAEEHGCQTPEGHRRCANNCGFFGSPATMNLCSKCYRDFCVKEQQQASIKSTVESSLSSLSSSSSSSSTEAIGSISLPSSVAVLPVPDEIAGGVEIPAVKVSPAEQLPLKNQPNRCAVCRKRVGLTGFKCRCETMFCGAHRYPEIHGCTFDFKALGREEISKANPVVKAEKLDKI